MLDEPKHLILPLILFYNLLNTPEREDCRPNIRKECLVPRLVIKWGTSISCNKIHVHMKNAPIFKGWYCNSKPNLLLNLKSPSFFFFQDPVPYLQEGSRPIINLFPMTEQNKSQWIIMQMRQNPPKKRKHFGVYINYMEAYSDSIDWSSNHYLKVGCNHNWR